VWHLLAVLANTLLNKSPNLFVVATKCCLLLTGKARDRMKEMDDLNFHHLHQASSHLDSELDLDAHFHARDVANLVEGCKQGGARGAGSLTTQHLTHLAALCGFLPKELLLHAKIGKSFNSCSSSVDRLKDTRQLLARLCKRLGVNSSQQRALFVSLGRARSVNPAT